MGHVSLLSTFSSPRLHHHHRRLPVLCKSSGRGIGVKPIDGRKTIATLKFGNFCNKSVSTSSDDPVREWILTEGKATNITRISPVGGGCINLASRYDTDVGSFFVKTNRSIGPSMFEGEALGLNSMYATKSIRVPRPFKVGELPRGGSYIIMEFIEFGRSKGGPASLGRKLAEMHKAGKSNKGFGFDVDNTIGSTPQINTWSTDWVDFFAEHRLGSQLNLALEQYGDSSIYEKGQRLMKNMRALFENIVIEPCLLHGDLWSGNISADKNGDPVILDPACYCGGDEEVQGGEDEDDYI